jgi:hypothetical protein
MSQVIAPNAANGENPKRHNRRLALICDPEKNAAQRLVVAGVSENLYSTPQQILLELRTRRIPSSKGKEFQEEFVP